MSLCLSLCVCWPWCDVAVPAHRYLHVSGNKYGRPIEGQYEISAVASKSRSNQWKAMEGVYMEPDNRQL